MKVSVIVPVYNEEKVIGSCLASLARQDYRDREIIVVDDGSTDRSASFAQYHQKHLGPGAARNLGASKAKGEILVFVDADMEFAPDFIKKLVDPIGSPAGGLQDDQRVIGTFSKEEYLLNKDNIWARLWNLNLGRQADKMHPDNYPDQQPVFRAILKREFDRVGGFDTKVGYTDDWSLARKLGVMAVAAPGARFYHRNPETLAEVWEQARWFGKNEFLTRNIIRRIYNLLRYFPPFALFSLYNPQFFIFKLVYNSAVFTSVMLAFFNEKKYK